MVKHYLKLIRIHHWVMKYSLDAERDSDGDPVEVILDDKILFLLGITFAVILSVMIYGNF